MKIYNILTAFILISLITSCSSNVNNSNISKFNLSNNIKTFNTLAINTDIEITSPEKDFNVNADFKFVKKDTLNSTVNGPFGITVAKMVTTLDTLLVYSILENKLYCGKPDQQSLNRAININLGFNDLLNILITEIPNGFSGFEYFQADKDGNEVLRRIDKERGLEFIVLDKTNNSLVQYQYKGNDGQTKMNVMYGDYKIIDGMNFANSIEIQLPQQNSKIKMNFTEIINNPIFETPLMFKTPKNSEIIRINDMKTN